MDQYLRIKIVGRGANGAAILCKRKKDMQMVVVKELFEKEMSEEDRKQSMNEIQVLSMLKHPNIIAYYDSFTVDNNNNQSDSLLTSNAASAITQSTDKSLMIIMEYADGGTLFDLIQNQKSYFSEQELMYFFVQIAMAMHHVHSHNILHRDLKTSNILICGKGPNKVLKIADFGISKLLSTKTKAETIVGTPSYLSPELCEGKPYNKKSDIWALGCVLAEIACLKRFFDATNLPALVLKIMRGAHEQIPNQYSDDVQNLIKAMCASNPTKRPDMNEIIGMPFLQEPMIDAQMTIGRPLPFSTER
ncbi:hypothetical protein MP228_004711 [Amoeboaphelidium protococcarum]|nr:hypothetical protein MP228_004711 [Amoeboaphelidium protococcarum]